MESKLKVTLRQGQLQGTYYKSNLNGSNYCAFLGIPYAEAPVKDLRFKPPVPLERWNGILNATKEKEVCTQYSFVEHKAIGLEDCLYLNVFTPEYLCDIKQLKAVIVHIHYGGNFWGSNSIFYAGAPDFIVHHDIVYVVMNYRLHVLGFLNLNILECAGNMGLKDQVQALKWIQENIKYFGGDPNNVTLIGCSSGATAIHYHMMSPMSRGLFHKVIMQSGYGYSPSYGMMEDPIGTAFEFGKILGFRGKTVESLYSFLKRTPAADFVGALYELRQAQKSRNPLRWYLSPFLPSVEIFPDGAFFSQSPIDLLYETVSVPMICAQCEVEGTAVFLIGSAEELERAGLEEIVKKNLWMYKISDETAKYVAEQIQLFYFGAEKNISKCGDKLLELYGDLFMCDWQNMVDFQSQKADVYCYLFTFQGGLNFQRNVFFKSVSDKINGSFHADDNAYFAYSKVYNGEIRRREKIMIENMGMMFTNFAKFGKPDHKKIDWTPHTPDNPCFLKFDLPSEIKNGFINDRRTTLWKDVMKYIRNNERKPVNT